MSGDHGWNLRRGLFLAGEGGLGVHVDRGEREDLWKLSCNGVGVLRTGVLGESGS